jgi:ketosteroid isomerase-like protein
MRIQTTLLAAAAAALMLAGCEKANMAGDKPATDTAAIEKALKADEAQWNADYKAKDLAKVSGHYAPDAALMEPETPIMSGPAVTKGLGEFLKDPNLDIHFEADKVGVAQSGDLAYTRGHYHIVTTNPKTGKAQTEDGSYVTVYRKQADGSWKAVEDIASPGAPAAG